MSINRKKFLLHSHLGIYIDFLRGSTMVWSRLAAIIQGDPRGPAWSVETGERVFRGLTMGNRDFKRCVQMLRLAPRVRIVAGGLGLSVLFAGFLMGCAPHPCKEDDVSRLKCDPSVEFSSALPRLSLPGEPG